MLPIGINAPLRTLRYSSNSSIWPPQRPLSRATDAAFALDVYAHGGPTPATISRYEHKKRGLAADSRVIRTLRKFEEAFELPEGYFLEEQIDIAERELRTPVREGLVSLADLETLIEKGRRKKQVALVPGK